MIETSESVIDEICELAGTSDSDHAVLAAAAALLIGERLRAREAEERLSQVERDAERKLDALLNHCPDMECGECGRIICKFGDPMHFHHDGCPSCANGWNNET